MGDPLDGLPDVSGLPHITEGPEPRTICVSPSIPASMIRSTIWKLEDFDLHKELYRGKTSLLYSATCKKSGMHIALKLYRKKKLSVLNRYQVEREIRIHISLDHENCIKLYAAFEDKKNVYMVQEFAGCGDLFEDLKRNGGQLKEKQAVRDVIAPFLSAISYLHSLGIIHRDIKPENILLTSNKVIKVADFGLSINYKQERPVTRAGTLDYMAPEVLVCPDKRKPEENKEKAVLAYTVQVDAWAAGILAYELLVGYPPFEQESRAATYEHIMYKEPKFPAWMSDEAKSFINVALSKNATQRMTADSLRNHPWLQHYAAHPLHVDSLSSQPSRLSKSASRTHSNTPVSLVSTAASLQDPRKSVSRSSSVIRKAPASPLMYHQTASSKDLMSNNAERPSPNASPASGRCSPSLANNAAGSPACNLAVASRLRSSLSQRKMAPAPLDINSSYSPYENPLSNGSADQGNQATLSPASLGSPSGYFRPQAGVLSDDNMCPSPRMSAGACGGSSINMTPPPGKTVSSGRIHLTQEVGEMARNVDTDGLGASGKYAKLFAKMWGGAGQAPPPPLKSPGFHTSNSQFNQPSPMGHVRGPTDGLSRENSMSRKPHLKGLSDEIGNHGDKARTLSREGSLTQNNIAQFREDSVSSVQHSDCMSSPLGMNSVDFKQPNRAIHPTRALQPGPQSMHSFHHPSKPSDELGFSPGRQNNSFSNTQQAGRKIQGALANKIEQYVHSNNS
eukprot:gene5086-34884_t